MYKLSRFEKERFIHIAALYGCKLQFDSVPGGTFGGQTIQVGDIKATKRYLYSTFFHELGHFVNWKTGKYPLYHDPKNFSRLQEHFDSPNRMVRYALQAEIYTEKVGRRLCKEWFPEIKYEAWYRNTRYCLEFVRGYNR